MAVEVADRRMWHRQCKWQLQVVLVVENACYELQCASFMTCVHVNAVCSLCVWANVEPSISLLPNCQSRTFAAVATAREKGGKNGNLSIPQTLAIVAGIAEGAVRSLNS